MAKGRRLTRGAGHHNIVKINRALTHIEVQIKEGPCKVYQTEVRACAFD